MTDIGRGEEVGEGRVFLIAQNEKRKWYNKPNLSFLYLILIPCGLGVEWTSGFDSSMMNSLSKLSAPGSIVSDSIAERFCHETCC
jgi:hypothetical protein